MAASLSLQALGRRLRRVAAVPVPVPVRAPVGGKRRLLHAGPGRAEAAAADAAAGVATWTLRVATVLERFPVLAPRPSRLSRAVARMHRAEALEGSVLSEAEAEETQEEQKRARERVDREQRGEKDAFSVFEMAEDKYRPAPRRTAADHANEMASVDRQLAQSLFLVVKEPASGEWRLPATTWAPGECTSLRLQAEGALAAACGTDFLPFYRGNAPSHCQVTVDEGGQTGTKTFYFRAAYVEGTPQAEALAWVTLAEADGYLGAEECAALKTFVLL